MAVLPATEPQTGPIKPNPKAASATDVASRHQVCAEVAKGNRAEGHLSAQQRRYRDRNGQQQKVQRGNRDSIPEPVLREKPSSRVPESEQDTREQTGYAESDGEGCPDAMLGQGSLLNEVIRSAKLPQGLGEPHQRHDGRVDAELFRGEEPGENRHRQQL